MSRTTIVTDTPAPVKVVRLPPTPGESWAAEVARKGAQARINGVTVTARRSAYPRIECDVTSQTQCGGYQATLDTVTGEWTCKCEAWERGRLCPHVALLRTDVVPCPVCQNHAVLYADADNRGAVRCLTAGCLRADLTADETEAVFENLNRMTDKPIIITALLVVVALRVRPVDLAVA